MKNVEKPHTAKSIIIKGILVHFFHCGTNGDYYRALKAAVAELELLTNHKQEEPNKDCEHYYANGLGEQICIYCRKSWDEIHE